MTDTIWFVCTVLFFAHYWFYFFYLFNPFYTGSPLSSLDFLLLFFFFCASLEVLLNLFLYVKWGKIAVCHSFSKSKTSQLLYLLPKQFKISKQLNLT
jgi:hypothetical protein